MPDRSLVLEGHLAREAARRSYERFPLPQAALRDLLGRLHGAVSPRIVPLRVASIFGLVEVLSSHLPLAFTLFAGELLVRACGY